MKNTCLYDFEMEGLMTMQPPVIEEIAIEVRTLPREHDAYVLEEHFNERRHILERNVMIPRSPQDFDFWLPPS